VNQLFAWAYPVYQEAKKEGTDIIKKAFLKKKM